MGVIYKHTLISRDMESKSPEDITKYLTQLREWLHKQPHLPRDIDDRMLTRFLHSCYYDIEKTQKCIEKFFTIRAKCIDLITNRDPTSDAIKTVFSITNLASIRLRDGSNLHIWQLNDPGMRRYDYVNDARVFFSQTDVWIDEDEFLETRDLVLMDVKDISIKFLTKFSVSTAKRLGQYQQEALPIRLKEVHLVNCPGIIDKLFTFMKPFIPDDICKLVHFHPPNSDSLYKYINKEELPSDFGGEAPSMVEHMRGWVKRLENRRDFLTQDNLWVADDTKKTKESKISNDINEDQSFRTLELD